MSKSIGSIYEKQAAQKVAQLANSKIIDIMQDFAREDFVNPFEELARMKLQAQKLIKELKKEQ